MFNIGKCKIKGIENTGLTVGHIQQCIDDKNKNSQLKYTYFGKYVAKGSMIIHTCKGDFKLIFDENKAIARNLEIAKVNK